MYTDWTRHLKDTKDKEDFEQHLLSSKRILDRLKALIAERELSVEASERSLAQFDKPNWAEKQAFKNGFMSCMQIVKTLIDLDKQIIKET